MERLDSKYFESTIAALKKAKAAENFELSNNFKTQLRADLMNRGTGLAMMEEEETGLWDFILRFKYVLGLVPMFAILMVVVANVSNWQAKVAVQEFAPEQLEKASLPPAQQRNVQEIFNSQVDQTPSIVTFSAASVMPPDEVLAKMWAQNTSVAEQNSSIANQEQNSVQELSFMEGNNLNLKITVPNIDVSGASFLQNSPQNDQATQQSVSFDEVSAVSNSSNTEQVPENAQSVEPATMPLEVNGRVEEVGQVVTQPEVQTVESAQTNSDAAKMVETAQKSLQVTADPGKVESMDIQFQPENKLQINSTQPTQTLSEARSTELNYQDEFTQMTPANAANQVEPSMMMVIPIYLKAEKIDYAGKNRSEIVKAVEHSLADLNGSLSSDYYVKVIELENSKYKVVLFEYGRVERVVVLAYRDGKLTTVTELNY